MWYQQQIMLSTKSRGFHLVTDEIVSAVEELPSIKIGLLHLQLLHTSASLTLNENADPTVRDDFEQYFNRLAKENERYYKHTYEGSDDMPAHLKASLLGSVNRSNKQPF